MEILDLRARPWKVHSAYTAATVQMGGALLEPFLKKEEREIERDFYLEWARRIGANSVLDLATGKARIPIIFARDGVSEITALDASRESLECARTEIERELSAEDAARITLVQGDMRRFSFPKLFDLATIAYQSFWWNFAKNCRMLFRYYERGPHGKSIPRRVVERTGLLIYLQGVYCVRSVCRSLRTGGVFIVDHPFIQRGLPHVEVVSVGEEWWRGLAHQCRFKILQIDKEFLIAEKL